jgi:ribosomal protein L37AE/L43A
VSPNNLTATDPRPRCSTNIAAFFIPKFCYNNNIFNTIISRKKKNMTKIFSRKIENFICEKCGTTVKGSGYTDHCPHCLWSKHVDINPGDRAAVCGGAMKPIAVETKGDGYVIIYRCEKCNHTHRVKAAPTDNFETILKITKETQ